MRAVRQLRKKWRTLTLGESYALGELDWKLRRYLDFRKGFYVEAGANNGIRQSNTLHFEKHLGWRGLLIEPIPELARQCQLNRPHNLVESCALVPFGYEEETIEMQYCNLMSLVKGAMGSQRANEVHLARGSAMQKLGVYDVTVPARTLTDVLSKHHIEHVDLLSLDVEGFELEVLKGLDFERFKPTFMLIEVRDISAINRYLNGLYEPIDQLSRRSQHSDILYKASGMGVDTGGL